MAADLSLSEDLQHDLESLERICDEILMQDSDQDQKSDNESNTQMTPMVVGKSHSLPQQPSLPNPSISESDSHNRKYIAGQIAIPVNSPTTTMNTNDVFESSESNDYQINQSNDNAPYTTQCAQIRKVIQQRYIKHKWHKLATNPYCYGRLDPPNCIPFAPLALIVP
eukprot:799375_1